MNTSWLARIRVWATPPHFDNEEKDRVARLLHYFLLAVIVGASLNWIAILIGGVGIERAMFPLVITLVSVLCYVLSRFGQVRLVGIRITSSLWLITTVSAVTSPMFPPPSLGFYVMTIILAVVLLDERITALFTIISILAIVVMVILAQQGLIPTAGKFTPGNIITFYTTLFLASGTVLYMTARSIRSSFIRVRQSEQTLGERNDELEHQITERHKVEAERDRLFELSLDLMAVLGSDMNFRRLNPAFENVLGYTEAEMLGKPLTSFVHADDLAVMQRVGNRLAEGLQITNFECQFICKDSQSRMLSWNIRPVEGVIYAVARDVTERQEAEQNQMALALAVEKATTLTDFLATMSHDIKTPLTVINTSLYLLERLEDPEQQNDRIQAIKEQTRIVERFVQDILAISRLDYETGEKREQFSLTELLSEIVRLLSPNADRKRIRIQLEMPPTLPPITANYEELKRVFTNLIENALNYTRENGLVDIRTLAEADQAVVIIVDTRIRSQEQDLPHIFERFYRSDQARLFDNSGSGLGLAIVKKILEMHAGTIDVTSVLNK